MNNDRRKINWNLFGPAAKAYLNELIRKDFEDEYNERTINIPGSGEGTPGSEEQISNSSGGHPEANSQSRE